MNRPKFCVGEQVMVRSEKYPEFDVDKTEVTAIRHIKTYSNWSYQTQSSPPIGTILHDGLPANGWTGEPSLRKLPPDERLSQDEMMSKLNKGKVLEEVHE